MDQMTYNPAAELTILVNKLVAIYFSNDDVARSEMCFNFYCDVQLYKNRIRIEISNNKLALSKSRFDEYIELLKFRISRGIENFSLWASREFPATSENLKTITHQDYILGLRETIIYKSHFGKKNRTILSQGECAIFVMTTLYSIQDFCIDVIPGQTKETTTKSSPVTIQAPPIALLCKILSKGIADEKSPLHMNPFESPQNYCERVCKELKLPAAGNARKYFKAKETPKHITDLRTIILPLLTPPVSTLVTQYLESKRLSS